MTLGEDKNLDKMMKLQQIFPKLRRRLLYDVFHNVESQKVKFVDLKKGIYKKRSKGNFLRKKKYLKTAIVIRSVKCIKKGVLASFPLLSHSVRLSI